MSMEITIDLGPMPVDQQCGFAVEGGGLRGLLERKELCDVVLTAGGQSFFAHSMVLAAVSPSFCTLIQQELSKGKRTYAVGVDHQVLEIPLHCTHPEAVQDLIDCIYGSLLDSSKEIASNTEGANRDSICLAQSYQIPQLQEQACGWLTNDLTTQNVLERLAICEDFQLFDVREKIIEQLIADPVALPMLASDPEIIKVPKVLQDLLVRILTLLNASATAPPQTNSGRQEKKSRKAGA